MTAPIPSPAPPEPVLAPEEPRWAAFRSAGGAEVFHGVVSTHDVWRADLFDVEEVHAEAREVFARTVARAAGGAGGGGGRIFLLRGESGAGKTHLMRAFRQHVHGGRRGWFAYLQMTANAANYARYVLDKVMDSLGEPYDLASGAEESGLQRLSDALAGHPAAPADQVKALREGEHDGATQLVVNIAEALLDQPAFVRAQADTNVLRALLFLQRQEPAFSRRVMMYLRCQAMTSYDSEFIGDLPPRPGEDEPEKMLAALGRLMSLAAPAGGAFVLCLDQMEDAWQPGEEAKGRFLNAMKAVRAIADPNPAAVVVAACLSDYWDILRGTLGRTLLDRFETEEPQPVTLQPECDPAQVAAIVSRRLEFIYEAADVAFRPEEPVFPFHPAEVSGLAALRVRDVLANCRAARERSVLTGEPPRLLPGSGGGVAGKTPAGSGESGGAGGVVVPPPAPVDPAVQETEARWNDFLAARTAPPPEDDAALAELLAWAIGACNAELAGRGEFGARAQGRFVEIDAPAALADTAARRWVAGLCQGRSVGGQLARQLTELTTLAGPGRAAVPVRGSAFPGGPRTKLAEQMGALVKAGGWRVVVGDADWRALGALREFLRAHGTDPGVMVWRIAEQPFGRLPGLRALLLLDKLPPPAPSKPRPPEEAPVGVPPPPENLPPASPPADNHPPESLLSASGPLLLGRTRETVSRPVLLPVHDLTRHAAFLGSAGSGKTTLALALVEEILLRGIPAILVDRKGDLASYARPESWTVPLPTAEGFDAGAEARRAQLRERVDVQLFTPGDAAGGAGRPLGIALLPRGAGALPAAERELVTRTAASSLGAMLRYKAPGPTASRLTILGRALDVLAQLEPEGELSLERLIGFIADEDASLVAAIGHLDTKGFKKVVQDLENFRHHQGWMLAAGDAPRVDAEMLLGVGAHAVPGRARLSVISTKFFTDGSSALFWVAQLLMELGRFAARRPADTLQGVVLFDEADIYLPATGTKPPTKEGMENALRRWRSAGIGVLLSSQNPGDFDYKCRDQVLNWFVGKVSQDTALAKMRPMLRGARTDVTGKLAALGAGQFFAVREGSVVESLDARRSLVTARQVPDAEILRLATGR